MLDDLELGVATYTTLNFARGGVGHLALAAHQISQFQPEPSEEPQGADAPARGASPWPMSCHDSPLAVLSTARPLKQVVKHPVSLPRYPTAPQWSRVGGRLRLLSSIGVA